MACVVCLFYVRICARASLRGMEGSRQVVGVDLFTTEFIKLVHSGFILE